MQLEGNTPEEETLLEMKTSKKAPAFDKISKSFIPDMLDILQLQTYALLITEGKYPLDANLLYLVKTKVPKLVSVSMKITTEKMEQHKKNVLNISEIVERQIWMPTGRLTFYCGKKYCNFFEECSSTF